MAISTRRSRTQETNIWPGFVDALAALLMVIIFVLMIFIVAQFYLTQLLSGRDDDLAKLQGQILELGELLSIERTTNKKEKIISYEHHNHLIQITPATHPNSGL